MKTKEQIEQEIDQTLAVLDRLEPVAPPAFFLTRTEARLRTRMGGATPAERVIGWAFRPAWVAASLGLALLLNLSVVAYARNQFQQHEQEEESASLVDEWNAVGSATDW